MQIPARIDTRFRGGMSAVEKIDRIGLAADLRKAVEGEVRFDTATRALYATDASNYRQPPIGVVIPRTLDDVVAVHAICHEHRAPILPRGCGTSLSGETVNTAVVVDFTKYLNDFDDPDMTNRTVLCRPGAINEKVNEHTGKWNWIFGPDPSTHSYCSIGGNVGNNSCGTHSVQSQFYGPGPRTSDNVHSLEILTHDGVRMWVGETSDEEYARIAAEGGRRAEIYRGLRELIDRYAPLVRERFPAPDKLPRRVSGYNLDELLPENGFNLARAVVGTEGTCATILQARLHLTPAMLERALVVVAFEDVCTAADQVPWILEHRPIGLEAMDNVLYEDEMEQKMHTTELSKLPAHDRDGGWLFVEFGADDAKEADEAARAFAADARKHGVGADEITIVEDPGQEAGLWLTREGGLGATTFPPMAATTGPAGRTRPSRPRAAATTCAT